MMIHAEPRYYGYLPGKEGPKHGKRMIGPISYGQMMKWRCIVKLYWAYHPEYKKKGGRR